MRILYYDCFAGISGDMNLAAMLALGVDAAYLRGELSRLGLDHEFELRVSADSRGGISGTRVDVHLTAATGTPPHAMNHAARPAMESTSHSHAHAAHHRHEHMHRNLRDIEAIIERSTLPQAVKDHSLRIFRRLAEAEARVHGKPINEVHFHEVGATDAIVDIVGAAICRHRLAIDEVWASPVELGGGFTTCAHGVMPVPAPATAEILQGVPTTRGTTRHEATTPTGAAIIAELVDTFTASPRLLMEQTAYGIGHRQTEIPNVLRVHLARDASDCLSGTVQQARLLQCNIDDMTAEMLGVAMDVFMEQGAMDVHFTPILMKKNRPATCVSLLCAAEDEARFKELFFRHTTTLGIKSFPLEKTILDIAFERLETPLGPVTLKHAKRDGKILRTKPELEDCRELTQRYDMSLAEVYAVIAKHRNELG